MPRKKATPKKNVQKRVLPKTLAKPRPETEATRRRKHRADTKRNIVDHVCGVTHPARPLTDLDYALLPIGKHLDAIREAVKNACTLRAATTDECVANDVEKFIAQILNTHVGGVVVDDVHVICDSRIVDGPHIVGSDLHRDDDGNVPTTYHRARVARFETEFRTVEGCGREAAHCHMTLDAVAGMELEWDPDAPDDPDVSGYRHVRALAQEDLVMNGVASPGVVAQIFDDVLRVLDWPIEAREALAIEYERSTDLIVQPY